jgi:Uma2 family endonuclease
MIAQVRLMTADELLRIPEDGFRYELVRGELRKTPPSGNVHGRLAGRLTTSLGTFVYANYLGEVYAAETGFKLATNPDTVRAPDVAFVARERLEAVGEVEGFWPAAPDLVVEVISPSESYTEVEEKVVEWLEAGTRMVVTINPRRRLVAVYRSVDDSRILTESGTLDASHVVPGWSLPVREGFQ